MEFGSVGAVAASCSGARPPAAIAAPSNSQTRHLKSSVQLIDGRRIGEEIFRSREIEVCGIRKLPGLDQTVSQKPLSPSGAIISQIGWWEHE